MAIFASAAVALASLAVSAGRPHATSASTASEVITIRMFLSLFGEGGYVAAFVGVRIAGIGGGQFRAVGLPMVWLSLIASRTSRSAISVSMSVSSRRSSVFIS